MNQKMLIRTARRQGWTVSTTRRGHLRWLPPNPDMPIVVGAGTPSDHRSQKNLLARLRRSGLVLASRGPALRSA